MGAHKLSLVALFTVLLTVSASDTNDKSSATREEIVKGQSGPSRAKSQEESLDTKNGPAKSYCDGDLEASLVCSACTGLDIGIDAETCCMQQTALLLCNALIHDTIEAVESGSETDENEVDEKKKRYGNLFSNWDWSSKDKNEQKRYGATFSRWGWSAGGKRSDSPNPDLGLGLKKNVNSVDDNGSSQKKEKRYGGTFNNWGWSNKDKRYGGTFNKWGWSSKDKRYGSTFNNWNWGKRDRDLAKRYGSTFSGWNWHTLGKRNADVEKRYGSTFNRWLWGNAGKRHDELVKRYGSTFNDWNWRNLGKRNGELAKRYGSTFNKWNWGKRDGKDGRFGDRYAHLETPQQNISNDGGIKSKRYGYLFGRLFSSG